MAKKYVSKHFNLANVPIAMTVSLPVTTGTPTVRVTTLARDAQDNLSSSKLIHHYDTLFERELVPHSDKAFTLQLVTSFHHGVHIGYKGRVGPDDAQNLPSVLQHPHIIDVELTMCCGLHTRPIPLSPSLKPALLWPCGCP